MEGSGEIAITSLAKWKVECHNCDTIEKALAHDVDTAATVFERKGKWGIINFRWHCPHCYNEEMFESGE